MTAENTERLSSTGGRNTHTKQAACRGAQPPANTVATQKQTLLGQAACTTVPLHQPSGSTEPGLGLPAFVFQLSNTPVWEERGKHPTKNNFAGACCWHTKGMVEKGCGLCFIGTSAFGGALPSAALHGGEPRSGAVQTSPPWGSAAAMFPSPAAPAAKASVRRGDHHPPKHTQCNFTKPSNFQATETQAFPNTNTPRDVETTTYCNIRGERTTRADFTPSLRLADPSPGASLPSLHRPLSKQQHTGFSCLSGKSCLICRICLSPPQAEPWTWTKTASRRQPQTG